jgi:acyl-CoA reductase-like NAD-dependent aldehyde dehydrogenase
VNELAGRFAAMRAAAGRTPDPPLACRRAHLRSLERAVRSNARAIVRAVTADFGRRSAHETRLTEIFPTVVAAHAARRDLARWMAPQRAPVALYFQPGRARTVWQPVGVAGIVAPWNYPLLLAFGPLIAALAAGNRVMIKMSELTPRTAEVLARVVRDTFADDHVALTWGGADVGQAFCALPFDHLLFTGSTLTGRSVMRAAAANLTPVTLELGGKSPALVGPDAPLRTAAARIMSGKLRNAGQTCIAPDYALVLARDAAAFIAAAQRVVARRYPRLPATLDYTSIVSGAHLARLRDVLADAVANGATVVPLHPHARESDAATRFMAPAILTGVHDGMRIMREEIFGPLLPLRTYATLDEALAYINARPRPLALYYFGRSRAAQRRVERDTVSGGICINDVVLQFAQEALPFGGVGESGMGAYHGRAGFETFSHRKAVFEQGPFAGSTLLEPPYGLRFDALLRVLMR